MADVKLIIKQMKSTGMSDIDILTNLKELGIENAEEEMSTAVKEIQASSAKADEGGLQITKISGESEQTVDINNIIEGKGSQPGESRELMKKVAATNFSNVDELEDKLDQVIALLKALKDLNKEVLETNRDILVKLNRKAHESDKPTIDKLF